MQLFRPMIVACLLATSSSAFAAEAVKDIAEARKLTDTIMSKVTSGELDAAATDLKRYSIVPESEIDASIGQFKLQQSAIAQRFGASLGAEFVNEERIGESLVRFTYLHKFAKHPMRWSFFFYKGQAGWLLDTFQSNDNITSLF